MLVLMMYTFYGFLTNSKEKLKNTNTSFNIYSCTSILFNRFSYPSMLKEGLDGAGGGVFGSGIL